MSIFDGTIRGPGHGYKGKDAEFASFEKQFPEFLGCHRATINCNLDTEVDTERFKVHFAAKHGDRVWEFIRINFEYPIGKETRGWIYSPFGSYWHSGIKNFVEVTLVRQLVPAPREGEACRVHILPA